MMSYFLQKVTEYKLPGQVPCETSMPQMLFDSLLDNYPDLKRQLYVINPQTNAIEMSDSPISQIADGATWLAGVKTSEKLKDAQCAMDWIETCVKPQKRAIQMGELVYCESTV